MRCRRCHHDNDDPAKFCAACAAPLEPACSNCGNPLLLTAKFCHQCGYPAGAAGAAPLRFGAPESYTPKSLVEKILTSRASLAGERKQVTVLFADLKGSLELMADRDPEDARTLLDPVLERMMEAVHHYEGTVNQVMGDGIMALFGAPLAHEDHAVRACYAAWRMQDAIARYGEEIQRKGDPPVQIRVGLNSGDVVVRSIGSDLRMDYTAVGQTTHLAARMEQLARPGSILLTRDTLRLAEGYLHVKPRGAVPVKGLDLPVEIYELTSVGVAHSRLQAAAARGLTRFVGRDDELNALRQAMDRVGERQGQVVVVVGEAGVGKSRLVWELTHSGRTHGWRIIESASVPYGKATPYFPVIELLKAYFQIELGDGPTRIHEKVTGMVLSLDRALEPSLPALLSLLDVPVDDPRWERSDPLQRRQQTLESVKNLLLRSSELQPVLLIVEDLHWIDAETQTLLDSLVESLPSARLLLLVSCRPEYRHAWGGASHVTQLRLPPLRPESAEAILDALLGDDPSLEPVRALLISRTEGNPFFLEESVRTLVEIGALDGTRGVYRLVKSVATIRVPLTVQAILATRIDRLPPHEKQLLQAASVIGQDIPFDLLKAMANMPEEDLQRGLAQLQAAELVYERRLFPDVEYTFKHALTQEVAYSSLLHERRVGLHAQVVQATETLYGGRLTEHVERLAHHSVQGHLWEKALRYLKSAGAKALSRAANREAAASFDEALHVLARLPANRERTEDAIDLRFELRSALLPLAEFTRILDYLQEADRLAAEIGDQRRAGLLSVYMTGHYYLLGQYDQALEFGERALTVAGSLGDFSLAVAAHAYQGQVHYVRGDYHRAAALFRRNVDALMGERKLERFGLPQLPSVHSRTCLGWCLAELGEFAEALLVAEDAMRIADAVDHPLNMTVACSGLGTVLLRQGDAERAIPVFERGLALIQKWNVPLWFPRVAGGLGAAYTLVGRIADALPLLKEAGRRADAMSLVVGHSQLLTSLSEALLHARHTTTARELAGQALELARKRHERGDEAWALRLLGEIALRLDPVEPDSARRFFEDAIQLASILGMRPLIAHAQLGLGRLDRQLGRAGGHPHFAIASALFRELGLTRWTEEGDQALDRLH